MLPDSQPTTTKPLASDEVELCAEELEEVIAPGTQINHNETLVSDEVE